MVVLFLARVDDSYKQTYSQIHTHSHFTHTPKKALVNCEMTLHLVRRPSCNDIFNASKRKMLSLQNRCRMRLVRRFRC